MYLVGQLAVQMVEYWAEMLVDYLAVYWAVRREQYWADLMAGY